MRGYGAGRGRGGRGHRKLVPEIGANLFAKVPRVIKTLIFINF